MGNSQGLSKIKNSRRNSGFYLDLSEADDYGPQKTKLILLCFRSYQHPRWLFGSGFFSMSKSSFQFLW